MFGAAQRDLEEHAEYLVETFIEEMRRDPECGRRQLCELIGEVADRRGSRRRACCAPVMTDLLDEAESLLRAGLRDEAIARLEKLAFPKWKDEEECRDRYTAHMRAQRALQSDGKHP